MAMPASASLRSDAVPQTRSPISAAIRLICSAIIQSSSMMKTARRSVRIAARPCFQIVADGFDVAAQDQRGLGVREAFDVAEQHRRPLLHG